MLLLVHAILTLWVSWARGQEFTCEPPVIPNGDFAPKMDQYELDYVITYQCGNGFHPPLRGNEAECTALGWLPLPRCVRKPCGFPEIKHGRLLHADTSKSHFPVYEGRSLAYFCDYGYVPPSQAGLGVLTCTQDGWSPDIPCLRHCDMPIFENARATFTGKPFRPNDTMDYQCLDGYENRDGSTNGSMVCGEDGWSHLPTCFKSADKCGPPPEISNGDIASFPLKAYPPWSRVEYQCQAYYELQGPTDVTCSYGKWSKPPRCIEPCIVSKENLDGKNIRLKGSNDKTYYAKSGHILEFVCKSGRKAVTSARSFRALCLEGAVELPRCE
ncbi:complement factor H-related protein 4 isoform X4 [Pipistrellus kuhlii]|uniref:complement factor H-related protein 4 isoform X4 n=1 Tax=Pipistrellus kuhlii TaxID=59472 RepID=UPI001E2733A4|nr:complement factor H-related protein 4 isoform X4 [Pipistrellus kuhlii]